MSPPSGGRVGVVPTAGRVVMNGVRRALWVVVVVASALGSSGCASDGGYHTWSSNPDLAGTFAGPTSAPALNAYR